MQQFTGNFHAYSTENVLRYIWIMFIAFLPLFILLKILILEKEKFNFLINSEKK